MTVTVGYAGLSHLGIVSSIATASKGYQVVAFDPSPSLCSSLNGGHLPIVEPELPELLEASRSRIRFTEEIGELNECALVFFSLDLPSGGDSHSDTSSLQRLIHQVVAEVSPNTTLIVLSQVPPGFTRNLAETLPDGIDGKDLHLFYQAETLVFGQAVDRALHPERLIIGRDSNTQLPDAYAEVLKVFDCPIILMRYESAELAKISINALLVSSMCTTNTMAELCEAIGADWSEIVPALKLDKRIGQYSYLGPGLGIAGGNLERDLATVCNLADRYGTDAGVVRAWVANSHHRRDWALRNLYREVLSRMEDPVIAVLGLAYKQDTHSTKNSPSIALLDHLKPFLVRVFDPVVPASVAPNPRCHGAESELEACEGADALAVMTPWKQFAKLEPGEVAKRMRGRVVLDPYGVLEAEACRDAGLSYHTLGVPAPLGIP